MEVSQQSDAITHAVIGKVQSVEMGVSDSAALMHIFSTTLYTYPKLATVQEIICNGWDSHIISGRTDTALEITVTDENIVIRDFGPGIPHEKIGPIYGVFGNSTKRDDTTQTGGFGLGSKAPFSYTDNFEVVSNNNNVKSVYRVSKSSMEKGGKPSIDTMVQIPTEETGIRVTIPLKSSHDRSTFEDHIKEVIILGGIKATLNGSLIHSLPIHESPTGYLISSFTGTKTSRINLRYGNVVYPLPRMKFFADMWDQVNHNMNKLWNRANIVFIAEPDTISIAPSREALIFTDATLSNIKGLLAKFNPSEAKISPITIRQLNQAEVNKQIRKSPAAIRPDGLVQPVNMPTIRGATLEHSCGPYAFRLRKAALAHMISQRSLVVRGEDLIMKRAHHTVHTSAYIDKTVGKKFLRAGRIYEHARRGRGSHKGNIDSILQAPLMRYVTSPLLAMVRANENMDIQMLTYADQSYKNASNITFVNPVSKTIGGVENLMAFLFKRVLLARSKTAINQFFDQRRYRQNELTAEGWVVYQLPKSDKNYDEITKAFEDMGYEVYKYLPDRAERVATEADPFAEPKVKKVSPKRKGFLSLRSSYDGDYKLTTARMNCQPDQHVFDPVAYVVLDGSSSFSDFNKASSEQVWRIWGNQVAVITTIQVDKFIAKGIPEVSQFVHNYVDETLAKSKDFPRYLAFARHFGDTAYDNGRARVVRHMLVHPDLMASLPKKYRFALTTETAALVTFFEDDSYQGSRKRLPQCLELSKKVEQSKLVLKVKQTLKDSEWAKYVDLDAIGTALKCRVTGDPKLAVPYTIVREIFKEGLAQ